jgi:hypothetical protein
MLTGDELRQRDGGRCARCGSGQHTDIHHRFPRSGGRNENDSNKVALCRECHHWAHHHPLDAQAEGWVVTAEKDPATTPLTHWAWPAGPVLLLDDGYGSIGFWVEPLAQWAVTAVCSMGSAGR